MSAAGSSSGEQARVGWRVYLLLAFAALALFLPGRARLPPVDRDESRYLQATRQMLQTRDFVQIRFQDQPPQPAACRHLLAGAAGASAFGGGGRAGVGPIGCPRCWPRWRRCC